MRRPLDGSLLLGLLRGAQGGSIVSDSQTACRPPPGIGKGDAARHFHRLAIQHLEGAAIFSNPVRLQLEARTLRFGDRLALSAGKPDLTRMLVASPAALSSSTPAPFLGPERKKVEMSVASLRRILKLDRLRLNGLNGAKGKLLLVTAAQ